MQYLSLPLLLVLHILATSDRSFTLTESLEQAETVLAFLAGHDPLARRTLQITQFLHQATTVHIRRWDQDEKVRRRRDVDYMPGQIVTRYPTNGSIVHLANQAPMPIPAHWPTPVLVK